MTSAPEPRNRRALLIGIDRYPRLSEAEQLDGAVNDARAMAQTLIERFGFPEGDVRLLLDDAAARDAILAAMDRLVEETRTDDVVVFHFSGHGSQMTDREGDEADGLDETILPADSGRDPDPNRDISDDEIYDWLLRLTAKTPFLTLIFDCCHSATINRDAFGDKVRGVEADHRPVAELPPSPPWARRALAAGQPSKGAVGWRPWDRRWTLFAGCASDQQSHELRTAGASGVRHGALTHFLIQELQKAQPGDTWRDLYERVAPQVTAEFRSQTPQLEGVWDREVFGLRQFEPLRFAPINGRSRDGRVLLGAGAASGLRQGSTWEVYLQGAREAVPGTGLGLVEITSVSAFCSEGRVVQEARPDGIRRGCRAVERSHAHGDMAWSIEIVAPASWEKKIEIVEDGIRESPLLRRSSPGHGAESGAAGVRVYLLEPRRGSRPGDPAHFLGSLEEPVWVAVGRDGRLALPVRRAEAPDSAFEVVENLEKLVRFHHALALDNPTSALRGKVDLALERLADGGPVRVREEEGRPVFDEGEHLVLRITQPPDQELLVYAVDFGLSGRVALIYPPEGAREPVTRDLLYVGTRGGQGLPLTVPWDFPYENPGTPASGVEFIKLFVTTEPVNFGLLLQEAFRHFPDHELVAGVDDNPLGRLLSLGLWGRAYRGPRPAGPSKFEDWTTVTRSFVLRRRTRAW